MHDPCTVAHEVRWPWKDKSGYRHPILTIWHKDPEKDGSDDSCDWFGGRKNMPADKLEKIRQDFLFEGRDGAMSWFADSEYGPDLMGVGISMFRVAANNHFGHWSRKADLFLGRNLFDILYFIDNGCDSINAEIRRANAARGVPREKILHGLAHVIYAWILRRDRPWWKHPRWHFWHWRLQFHPWQNLKRRWWDKCSVCGKRGFQPGVSACGNWDGDKIWHSTCDAGGNKPPTDHPGCHKARRSGAGPVRRLWNHAGRGKEARTGLSWNRAVADLRGRHPRTIIRTGGGMTTHELARKLLAGPDVTACVVGQGDSEGFTVDLRKADLTTILKLGTQYVEGDDGYLDWYQREYGGELILIVRLA